MGTARPGPQRRAGMRRYGIVPASLLGVGVPRLRRLARAVGTDHRLARALWRSRVLEARLLAAMVDDPRAVSERQMEEWVLAFDSWALCDGVCQELFAKSRRAWRKAFAWSRRSEEFVKRAGFVLAAKLAVHDREAPNSRFVRFLRSVEREAVDDRRYVRSAVSWALREIGKRNAVLWRAAVASAGRVRGLPSPAARWLASDALRDLRRVALRGRRRPRPRKRLQRAPPGRTGRRTWREKRYAQPP